MYSGRLFRLDGKTKNIFQSNSPKNQTEAEKDLRGVVKITVGVGGAMCLAAAALQLLSLVPRRAARLPVLLKAATAGTHSAAVLALLECDTRQEEACPGALGWLCAACWCAGCAALCAQPLLLQAELAGRHQRAPSVALLAGWSIMLRRYYIKITDSAANPYLYYKFQSNSVCLAVYLLRNQGQTANSIVIKYLYRDTSGSSDEHRLLFFLIFYCR